MESQNPIHLITLPSSLPPNIFRNLLRKNGNALASTTLNPSTPNTLAFESTTAIASPLLPILQVAEAWYSVNADSRMNSTICSSLVTFGPGRYSSSIVTLEMVDQI